MKKNEAYLNTRRLYKSEIKKHFKGKLPVLFKLNQFFFRMLMPARFYFYMQQVVLGYSLQLALKRSTEWSFEQILIWQKERQ